VRLPHAVSKTQAIFDDEHVVAHGGLVPVMRLAERCDLSGLAREHVRVADKLGANTPLKIGSIVAGMIAGADSIDDLDVLRHGGMSKMFGGIRAPSTLGSFLRCLAWGNVRQIEKESRELLARLAGCTPQTVRGMGVGRRGRRNPLHGVRFEEEHGDHRPAHRPPRQTPRPTRRAARTAARLAISRGVHQQPVHDAPDRDSAPRSRAGRTGLRRSQRRSARAPAVG
jgi:hypothetical protein